MWRKCSFFFSLKDTDKPWLALHVVYFTAHYSFLNFFNYVILRIINWIIFAEWNIKNDICYAGCFKLVLKKSRSNLVLLIILLLSRHKKYATDINSKHDKFGFHLQRIWSVILKCYVINTCNFLFKQYLWILKDMWHILNLLNCILKY